MNDSNMYIFGDTDYTMNVLSMRDGGQIIVLAQNKEIVEVRSVQA